MARNQHRRHRPARSPLWSWVLALAFVLKAATPLLATAAADVRGVTLAEVCTAYGVRTVAVAPADGHGEHPAPEPHTDSQCVLSPLLHSAPLAAPAAAVLLHAPQQARLPQHAALPLPCADASRRWLAARLHAPPASI
jgi:hypothetical protein